VGHLPDWIVIGGFRCGTTSLYNYVAAHPSACQCVPRDPKRELHFFDVNWGKGVKWYKAFFKEAPGEHLFVGEKTPTYFDHPLVPQRMKEVCPEARILVLLRNPVERAYSHWWRCHKSHLEDLSFSGALDAEERRLATDDLERVYAGSDGFWESHLNLFSYLRRGRYVEHLERWLEHFPVEQIFVLKSEDMFADPQAVMADVFNFLGLPNYRLGSFKQWQHDEKPAMMSIDRARLESYFRPYNDELGQLLNRQFNWV